MSILDELDALEYGAGNVEDGAGSILDELDALPTPTPTATPGISILDELDSLPPEDTSYAEEITAVGTSIWPTSVGALLGAAGGGALGLAGGFLLGGPPGALAGANYGALGGAAVGGGILGGAAYRATEGVLEGRGLSDVLDPTAMVGDALIGGAVPLAGKYVAKPAWELAKRVAPTGLKNAVSAGYGAVGDAANVVARPVGNLVNAAINKAGAAKDSAAVRISESLYGPVKQAPAHMQGEISLRRPGTGAEVFSDVLAPEEMITPQMVEDIYAKAPKSALRKERVTSMREIAKRARAGEITPQEALDLRKRVKTNIDQRLERVESTVNPAPPFEARAEEGMPLLKQATRGMKRWALSNLVETPYLKFLDNPDPVARQIGQRILLEQRVGDRITALGRRQAMEAIELVDPVDRAQALRAFKYDDPSKITGNTNWAFTHRVQELQDDLYAWKHGFEWEAINDSQMDEMIKRVEAGAMAPEDVIAAEGLIRVQRQDRYVKAMYPQAPPQQESSMAALSRKMKGKATVKQLEQIRAGQGKKSLTEHAGKIRNPDEQIWDIEKNLFATVEGDAAKIARAVAWGGRPHTVKTPGGKFDTGELGRASLDYLRENGLHDVADAFEQYAVQLGRYETGADQYVARNVARMTSNVLLSRNFVTQWSEWAKQAVYGGGIGGTMRGHAIVAKNPVWKEVFEYAGGKKTPAAELMNTFAPVNDATSAFAGPGGLTGRAEGWLRTSGSYAGVDLIDRVSSSAANELTAGKLPADWSSSLKKQAAEIFPEFGDWRNGLAAQHLGKDYAANGGLSRRVAYNAVNGVQKRWMYSAAAADLPAFMRSPTGAVATQYKPFIVQAMKHVKADILDPITEGLVIPMAKRQPLDMDLAQLGLARLGRMVAYSMPANAATATMKAAMQGKLPSAYAIASQFLGGNLGMAGELGNAVIAPFSGNEGAIADLAQVPALGAVAGTGRDLIGGSHDLLTGGPHAASRLIRGAGKVASLVDPRLKLYVTDPLAGAVGWAEGSGRGK